MRLAFISDRELYFDSSGAVYARWPFSLERMINQFKGRVSAVFVFCRKRTLVYPGKCSSSYYPVQRPAGLPVEFTGLEEMPRGAKGYLAKLISYRRAAILTAEKADVLWFTLPGVAPFLALFARCRPYSQIIVAETVGEPETSIQLIARGLSGRIYGTLLRAATLRVLDASQIKVFRSLNLMRDLGYRDGFIASGSCLTAGDLEDVIRPSLGMRHPVLLYVGRLSVEKGPEILIRAVSVLSRKGVNCLVRLVGDGAQRTFLEKLVEINGLNESVQFIGKVAWGEPLWEHYRQADVLIIPSLTEGVPRVLFEGWAKGLPVVAARVGGLPEVVESGKNGLLVEPNDPLSLAQTLEILLQDEDLRCRLGKGALRSAREHTIEKQFGRIASEILRLVEGHSETTSLDKVRQMT